MAPPLSCALLRLSHTVIIAIPIQNIILGFASEITDSTLNGIDIPGTSVTMIINISLAVWALFSVIYIGLLYHYTRLNPFWTTANLVTVLLMTAFFTCYLEFDPFDWPIWAPLAIVLGTISRAGLEATYNSADCEQANGLYNDVWGSNNSGVDRGDAGTLKVHWPLPGVVVPLNNGDTIAPVGQCGSTP